MADGTAESDESHESYLPGCGPDLTRPISLRACIACGDGVCGTEENRCNCSEDCGEPVP